MGLRLLAKDGWGCRAALCYRASLSDVQKIGNTTVTYLHARNFVLPGRGRSLSAASLIAIAAGGAILTSPRDSHAQTIAYYRFEEGATGAKVPVTPDAGAPGVSPVLDSSGNGNHMKTVATFSAPTYAANVPAAVIPNTGASNQRSLLFTPNQDVYSQSAVGGGPAGGTLNDHSFASFTIEASVNFSDANGFQTFVGRDRPGQTLAGFYLRKWGGNGVDANAINATLVADNGTAFDLFSTSVGVGDSFSKVSVGTWYNVVAQSNGSVFSLFVQNNVTGVYELQGSTAVTTALSNLGSTNFTIGRGWFNNGPADFTNGFVDEVRISDTALAPSQFLFSAAVAPEPGTGALLAMSLLPLLGTVIHRLKRARN